MEIRMLLPCRIQWTLMLYGDSFSLTKLSFSFSPQTNRFIWTMIFRKFEPSVEEHNRDARQIIRCDYCAANDGVDAPQRVKLFKCHESNWTVRRWKRVHEYKHQYIYFSWIKPVIKSFMCLQPYKKFNPIWEIGARVTAAGLRKFKKKYPSKGIQ